MCNADVTWVDGLNGSGSGCMYMGWFCPCKKFNARHNVRICKT